VNTFHTILHSKREQASEVSRTERTWGTWVRRDRWITNSRKECELVSHYLY